MKTRVAKTIVQTIIWSLVLAGVATLITWTTFFISNGGDPDLEIGFVLLPFLAALVGGLVVWPLYFYVRINLLGAPPIVNTALTIILWTLPLTIWGGIAGFLIGAPFAFASSLITFTAYEVSKRTRFVRKQQDKSHDLVHHQLTDMNPTNNVMKISKKKGIALIGSSVLLLGMIPVLVILDPVGFRNNAAEDNDIVTVVEECGTPPLTLKQVDSEEFQVAAAAGHQSTYGIFTYSSDDAGNPVTFDEYWVLQDADNQVIAGLRRSYTANQDFRGELMWGCLDASVMMAFSDSFVLESTLHR